MDDELIAAHRDLDALMPYLHLPVQSGSDRVLAAMNRRHRRADYLRLIDRIRAARPDIAFAGDFIVGFPGESEADFADTLSIVDEVGYAAAFSFKYSPRPGTPAADVPSRFRKRSRPSGCRVCRRCSPTKQTRLQPLARRHRPPTCCSSGRGRHPGQIVGRSPWLLPVQVEADADADRHHRAASRSRIAERQQPVRPRHRRVPAHQRRVAGGGRRLRRAPSRPPNTALPRSPATAPISSSPSTTTG